MRHNDYGLQRIKQGEPQEQSSGFFPALLLLAVADFSFCPVHTTEANILLSFPSTFCSRPNLSCPFPQKPIFDFLINNSQIFGFPCTHNFVPVTLPLPSPRPAHQIDWIEVGSCFIWILKEDSLWSRHQERPICIFDNCRDLLDLGDGANNGVCDHDCHCP